MGFMHQSDYDRYMEDIQRQESKKWEQQREREALHDAVANSDFDLVKKLIDDGYNVNILDSQHWLPIEYAIENENQKMVEYLLDQNSEVSGEGYKKAKHAGFSKKLLDRLNVAL